MKQVFLPIIVVIIFIVAVGMFTQRSSSFNFSGIMNPNPTPSTQEIVVGNKTIKVTIVKTKDQRTKGLSGTTNLERDTGMLFVFDKMNSNPSFWMKDMLIPIDIIWINDNKIVKIDKSVPTSISNTPDNKLKIYSANQPVDYVLEVNSGFCEENNIKVGNIIDLKSL
jgi:hypothetical protein